MRLITISVFYRIMIPNQATNVIFMLIISTGTEGTGFLLSAVQLQGRLLSLVWKGAEGVGPPSYLISALLIHLILR